MRRRVEAVASGSATALGVRAALYVHQVGNLEHILTSPTLRYLLADEVGLGKTVQALMVINAVRHQHPRARIAVLVPDALMSQWRDELVARGHESPDHGEEAMDGEVRNVELLWPERLEGPGDLDPARFELLVVDELHNLTVELRDRLTRIAPDVPGLLLLSATPALGDPSRRLETLALLEPERVRLAAMGYATEGGLTLDLNTPRRWPAEHQRGVLARLEHEEGQAAREHERAHGKERDQAALAERVALTRRVIRTRRKDYERLLPHRHHVRQSVHPIDAERRREELVTAFLRDPRALPGRDRSPLGLRLTIGGSSLAARLGDLVREGLDLNGQLQEARELTTEAEGNSRLDALCDLLTDIFLDNPDEKVVVVCLDNPTIDAVRRKLSARLDEVGPFGQERPLHMEVARRGEAAAGGLLTLDSPAQQAIEAFKGSGAQLLLAGDIAEVGLNLQCARHLVLYGVPWGLDAAEQWIGRLDRLGQPTQPDDGRASGMVTVHTIVHSRTLGDRVTRLLAATGLFLGPVDLTSPLSDEVDAALGELLRSECGVVPALSSVHLDERELGLGAHVRRGPERAHAALARELDRPPVEPSLVASTGDEHRRGHRLRELALEGWLKLLDAAGHYKYRYHKGKDHAALWYTFRDTPGPPQVVTDVILPSLKSPVSGRDPRNATALRTRRKQIETPPRTGVWYRPPWPDAEPALLPLQFMGFGGLVHDDLVRTWSERRRRRGPVMLSVRVSLDHPIAASPGAGNYLLSLGWIDPGEHLLPGARSYSEDEETRRAAWGRAADQRWLRSALGAGHFCFTQVAPAQPKCQRWPVLGEEVGWRLLRPLFHPKGDAEVSTPVGASCQDLGLGSREVRSHLAAASDWFQAQAAHRWSAGRASLPDEAVQRSAVVEADAEVRRAELAARADLLEEQAAHLDEFAARVPRGRALQLSRELAALEEATRDRQAWLARACDLAEAPPVQIYTTLFMQIVT